MSELPDSPLSPTARSGSRLPVLRKQSSANGNTLRQPASSSGTGNSSRTLPGPKTRAPTGSPSIPSIAKRGLSSPSSTTNGPGSSNRTAEVRGSGLRKVPSKQTVLPSTAEDSASDTSSTSRSTASHTAPSKDPLKALKDQRRSSAVYVPAANIQRKPSTSQLSTPSINRRASASQLPTLSSLNKKVSAASLNKKPSSSNLSANASTVTRKTSSTNLQNSNTIQSDPPANKLDRKASNTNLSVHSGASQPLASQTRKISSSGGPKSPPTPVTAQRSPIKAPARQVPTTNTPRKPASRPVTAASEESSPRKAQSLRDAIAQARAAKNAQLRKGSIGTQHSNDDGVDFNTEDPFNTGILGSAEKALQKKVQLARTEGRLNIANLELKEIPTQVYSMYEIVPDNDNAQDGPKWYEAVDLVKLIAADNDIVEVGEELAEMFGGLVALDMHNNLINALPRNIINLTQLTSLNLTNNKLGNDVLELICGITSLLELKIARNSIEGDLTPSIRQLYNLELLEIYENKVTTVPNSIESLTKLKILNISHNSLERFPFEKLGNNSLSELVISHNALRGALFGSGDLTFKSLQSLDFRSNRISSLCEGNLHLPNLKSFFGSNNELSTISNMSEWTELLTFSADYNRLEQLPEGLTELSKLRVVDLTGNNLVTLDPTLGNMVALEVLKIEGNPLRERLIFNMSTADLKRTLKGRLAPPDAPPAVVKSNGDNIVLEEPAVEVLELSPGGVLDLSKRNIEDVSRELLESVNPSPITIEAHHNLFVVIPQSFEMFTASLTTLNLSHSKLSGEDYLPKRISLRWLSTLTLSSNSITSIQPLMKNLDAPKLEQLDIAANRVKDITGLRPTFPLLTRLYARDNVIEEIPVDTVDGMKILDLSGNSIATLPPKLGLVLTLRELRVEGNCFRVPRWQILEKGTDTILTWLRDKLPPDDTTTEDGFVSALEE